MAAKIMIVYNNLSKIAERLPEACGAIVDESARHIEANAKANLYGGHGVDTGKLKNSISYEMVSKTKAIVAARTDYAGKVEYGTRAHSIYPKNRKALYWRGASHPVKHVNHPGTRPIPFMRPAAEKERPFFFEACRRLEERLK